LGFSRRGLFVSSDRNASFLSPPGFGTDIRAGGGLARRAVGFVRSPRRFEQSGQAPWECRKMGRPLGRDRAVQGSPA
jgi:hypothetical protein